jgi:hypothetical protein
VEERQQFLKNAERWKLMKPDQRQAWRDLVIRLSLQPPSPFSRDAAPLPSPPMPPNPPGPKALHIKGALATNQN